MTNLSPRASNVVRYLDKETATHSVEVLLKSGTISQEEVNTVNGMSKEAFGGMNVEPPLFKILSDNQKKDLIAKIRTKKTRKSDIELVSHKLSQYPMSSSSVMSTIYDLIQEKRLNSQAWAFLTASFYESTGDQYFRSHRISNKKAPRSSSSRVEIDGVKFSTRPYNNKNAHAPLTSEDMWPPNKNPNEYAMHMFMLNSWKTPKEVRDHLEGLKRKVTALNEQFKWYVNGGYSHYGWKGEYDLEKGTLRIIGHNNPHA